MLNTVTFLYKKNKQKVPRNCHQEKKPVKVDIATVQQL